ncbi:MAG: M15 family metallopeptidase [Bacteroidota bacterium]
MNQFLLLLSLGTFLLSCQTSNQTNDGEPSVQQVMAEIDSLVPTEAFMPSNDTIPVSFLLGQFDPAKHANFARIADAHSAGSARGAYLNKEAYRAFVDMYDAAKADGVRLTIRSATRNFYRQQQIWEAKWNGKRKQNGEILTQTTPDPVERARKILATSSMPGTSRHHWGTDIDINAFENSYFKSGQGKVEYDWLVAHAHEHGFGQPYTEKGPSPLRETGYEEERWHWSYLPLARQYLADYEQQVKVEMISGFDGAQTAKEINVIENYVSGISPDCK